jgi:diguanylate cyclase (GGDEF)-like protein
MPRRFMMTTAMNPSRQLQSLTATARFLRRRANRHAWIGVAIALTVDLVATLLSCHQAPDCIGTGSWLRLHGDSPALLLIDVMPLIFFLWGQYAGSVLSLHAGALVVDEVNDLRDQKARLDEQLDRADAPQHDLGLPDRRMFAARLDLCLQQLRLSGGMVCAVLLVETDQYDELESADGAQAADELVDQIAARLRSVTRTGELLGHFGEDRFAVLLPQLRDESEALHFARRLQLAMETPLTVQRRALAVRTAIGVALAPQHGDDPGALLRHAESARIGSAAERRDVQIFDATLDPARLERPRLVAELHNAIHAEGLAEEYRWLAPLHGGAGARLRLAPCWPHPRRGRIEERELIAIPDRQNLAHALTTWLCGAGLERLALWRTRFDPRLGLVLRLPDAGLRMLPLGDLVTRLLVSHDLPGTALTLEFSESAITSGAHARSQLAALRHAAVNVCLAGVGQTGGTVTTPLYHPISEVAFSPVLVQRAAREPVAAQVLTNLVAAAKALEQRITFCGVDGDEMRGFVARLGGDYAEGAAIGPALAPEAVAGLFATSSAA